MKKEAIDINRCYNRCKTCIQQAFPQKYLDHFKSYGLIKISSYICFFKKNIFSIQIKTVNHKT